MLKDLQQRLLLLLGLVLAGAGTAWAEDAYETTLSFDCASASENGSKDLYGVTNTSKMDNDAIKTFLEKAAGVSDKITVSISAGSVYWAKGSGGSGIPNACLKVGTASGPGSFTFAIDNSYSTIDRVIVTGYGWKETSVISINNATGQKPTAAATQTTFTFDLSEATRSISLSVTSSAVCITKIELLSKVTGPIISASDVNVDADATSGEIAYTIGNPDGSTLKAEKKSGDWISDVTVDADNSRVTFSAAANSGAQRDGVITLTYGSVTKDVTVTQAAYVLKHTISWSVNGTVVRSEKVADGEAIVFADATEGIPTGYAFMGWTSGQLSTAQNTPPTYVTEDTSTEDKTFYAVLAKQTGEATSATTGITNSEITSYQSGHTNYSDDYEINGWTGRFLVGKSGSTYFLQLGYNGSSSKSAYNSHLTTPACSSGIKTITIKTNNSTASGRKFFLCSSDNIGAAKAENAAYGSGATTEANGSVTIAVTGSPKQLHIYPDGTAYIESISLTYGEEATYSGYCTTVATTDLSFKIGEAEWATYVAKATTSFPTGVKGYVVSGVTETSVTLAEVTTVTEGTAVLVNGPKGDYAMDEADEEDLVYNDADLDDNLLQVVKDGETIASAYVLAQPEGKPVAFYLYEGSGLKTGRVYLPTTAGARTVLSIGGGETTEILKTQDGRLKTEGTVFDLQGRRVATTGVGAQGSAVKGLYIVNGKKTLIK